MCNKVWLINDFRALHKVWVDHRGVRAKVDKIGSINGLRTLVNRLAGKSELFREIKFQVIGSSMASSLDDHNNKTGKPKIRKLYRLVLLID